VIGTRAAVGRAGGLPGPGPGSLAGSDSLPGVTVAAESVAELRLGLGHDRRRGGDALSRSESESDAPDRGGGR
jgi:hypothetical protein